MPKKDLKKDIEKWLIPDGSTQWFFGSHSGYVQAFSETACRLDLGFELLSASEDLCTLQVKREQNLFQWKGHFLRSENGTALFEIHKESHLDFQKLLHAVRKSHHIRICAQEDVESSDRFTGFEDFLFLPEALPDLNFEDLCIQNSWLGRSFEAPILITGMTGGVEEGYELNRRLARAAAHFQIPMGIGSQRMALEHPEYRKIFAVKEHAPQLFLIGNLGGSQLCGSDALDLCKQAVEMVDADALAIHLNVIQECVQAEGSPRFRGFFQNLEKICSHLGKPVLVKEVGSGIHAQTAKRLEEVGVSAIDCAGRGGTSWAYVEGLRTLDVQSLELAKTFRDWGLPTAHSLISIRKACPRMELIASGGMRDGLTLAKALALGANMVAFGLPLLRAARESEERLHQELAQLIRGLKVTMMGTGSQDLSQLKNARLYHKQAWKDVL